VGIVSVALFIPCFIDQLAPSLGQRLIEVMERLGVPWQYPQEQTCCGQFAVTMGDLVTARRLMRHFLRVFSQAEEIVCPSASCTFMVRHYYPRLAEGRREQEEVTALAGRTWELAEWLAAQGGLTWQPGFSGALVLHRSCKARQLGVLETANDLLSRGSGIMLKDVSPYFSCCGFGGIFKLQHPELSEAIGRAYLEAVLASGAEGLVSLDFSCLVHLKGVGRRAGLPLKFYHVLDIIR